MNRNYLIWQYHNKPKALGTINSLYTSTNETFENVLNIANILDIDKAKGYALDLIGRHVGIRRVLSQVEAKEYFGFIGNKASLGFSIGKFYRNGDSLNASIRLNDDDYRFFIKAKIMKNYQSGTLENIIDSIRYLTDDNSDIIDKMDMTMNIIINKQSLNEIKLFAVKNLDILVRPIGVLYQFLILVSDAPFGFFSDYSSYGFGQGEFVRLQQIGINK